MTFTASCTDKEDGNISSKVTWRSNRDGDIGTGASATKTLSAGTHTTTATCVDSNNHSVTQQVTITVNELLVRLNWVYFNFDQATLTRAGGGAPALTATLTRAMTTSGGGIILLGSSATLLPSGVQTYYVGGTLSVPANQPEGDYSGTFTLTVNYL